MILTCFSHKIQIEELDYNYAKFLWPFVLVLGICMTGLLMFTVSSIKPIFFLFYTFVIVIIDFIPIVICFEMLFLVHLLFVIVLE